MKDDLIPLHDILKEVEFLHSIRDRSDFVGFTANAADVRAASYSIIVISEAVRRIRQDWLDEHPATPWHAIRTIGNKLRHEYQRISHVILWGIIRTHAAALKATNGEMVARHSHERP